MSERKAVIKSGRRTIKLRVTGFDPKKARAHHKKHGDMHGKLCLLSECPIHYPKARRGTTQATDGFISRE